MTGVADRHWGQSLVRAPTAKDAVRPGAPVTPGQGSAADGAGFETGATAGPGGTDPAPGPRAEVHPRRHVGPRRPLPLAAPSAPTPAGTRPVPVGWPRPRRLACRRCRRSPSSVTRRRQARHPRPGWHRPPPSSSGRWRSRPRPIPARGPTRHWPGSPTASRTAPGPWPAWPTGSTASSAARRDDRRTVRLLRRRAVRRQHRRQAPRPRGHVSRPPAGPRPAPEPAGGATDRGEPHPEGSGAAGRRGAGHGPAGSGAGPDLAAVYEELDTVAELVRPIMAPPTRAWSGCARSNGRCWRCGAIWSETRPNGARVATSEFAAAKDRVDRLEARLDGCGIVGAAPRP